MRLKGSETHLLMQLDGRAKEENSQDHKEAVGPVMCQEDQYAT